jgi:serine/threonine protein kinase
MNERAIFMEALERENPGDRSAFLNTACAGDATLRQRVELLLRAHDQSGNFLGKLGPERLAEQLASPGQPDETAAEKPGNDGDLSFLAPVDKPGVLGRLGHYEVLEVIGRGGMGIVLRAFDEKLHRVVAIKVMAPQLAASAAARKRFTREAQAVAAVCHDHIVTIHAVEEARGLPYLVMQYVAGISLQERLDRDGPLQLQEILRVGMQTAAGLAAAHAQGIIHRDIKPANILLENGVERVKLTDFGLARAAADASLTQLGVVAGTPQYMSPEQARGEVVDPRSDLFSLGSVLYAMCTGRAPFRAETGLAVLKRVCEDTPSPIRDSNPEIPDWLVAIVDRLHAKDQAQRFASAAEVADLLNRHLTHLQHPSVMSLPIEVAPPKSCKQETPLENAGRATRGSRAPLAHRRRWALAAAIMLLLLGGLSFTEATGVTNLGGSMIRIFTADGTLLVETDDPAVKVTVEGDGGLVITGAGAQEVRLRPGSYRVQAAKDGKPVALDQELVTITRGGKQVVRVRLVRDATEAPIGEVRRLEWFERHVYSTGFSPDSRYYFVTGDYIGPGHTPTIRIWETATGKLVRELTGNEHAAFTPDSKRLLCPGPDKALHLWDLATGNEIRSFEGHTLALTTVAISPDGKRALSGSVDTTVRVWDLETGAELKKIEAHTRASYPLFAPDGKNFLTYSHAEDQTLRLWDAASYQEARSWDAPGDNSNWFAEFAPDGRGFLTLTQADWTVHWWDLKSDKPVKCLKLEGDRPDAAAFSSDCRRVIYAVLSDNTVRLVDLPGGKEVARFDVPAVPIGRMAISPDGRFAVGASWSGWVYLWRLPPPGKQAP